MVRVMIAVNFLDLFPKDLIIKNFLSYLIKEQTFCEQHNM